MLEPTGNTAKILLLSLAVLCLGISAGMAAQTDPAVVGRWSSVPDLPFYPVHLHVLPTGEVMIWPGDGGISGNDPRLWDPVTQATTPLAKPGYDVFCSGHSFLADGQLFVAGGHIINNVGLPKASAYNPFTDTWTALPNMNAGRWYPTSTTLANGDALVVSGSIDTTVGANPLPQVFQVTTGTWRDLTNAQLSMDLYPRMHVAPNGKVFNSSPTTVTRYLDTSGTEAWTAVANRSLFRDFGSSVLYDDGKILIMGGGDPPTKTAEVIDLNAASPAWRSVASMANARRQLNATILPDGKVLVTGGTSGPGFNNASFPVYAAEMWDPATELWTTMTSAQIPRLYHSAAALLPDGRLISTGGNGYPQTEVYEPPYLFKGARPGITSAPAGVAYGDTFFVQTPDAAGITQVTWIRLPSVTHAFNTEQRINRLSFSQTAGGLNVVAPSNPNLAPVGYYMLFILNSAGVPSVAQIVRINTAPPGPAPVPTLSSLSPNSAIAGASAFALTVNGSNFIVGSMVQWNGTARPTTFVSATQLTAVISANDLAVAGAASVAVVNPAPGGGASNALIFVINQASVTAGLVAAYGFDEGSGTTVGDSSGNGHSGVISGTTWTTSGKYGNALSFNGTNSYVSVANPNLPTGDYTWSAWINPNQTSTFRGIMVSHGTGPGQLEMDIDSGRVVIYTNDSQRIVSATIISTGVWTHLALSRAGSTIRLYLNGNQDPNTGTDAAAQNFQGCPLLIGVDNDSGCTGSLNGFFDGRIDEVRIYSRALSQAEIQSYMNTPITPPGPDTTPPDTNITATPANPSNSSSASFSFTSTEAGSSFECQLDGGSFGACTSPKSYTSLGDGSHIFYVRAIDVAGNVDPTPASYTWTSDVSSPTITITSPTLNPTYTTGSSPLSLGGTASDNNGVTQVTWANDRGGSGTASGTASWSASGIILQSGTNVLTVMARDAAGNTGTDALTVSYTPPPPPPDTTPPDTSITSSPSNPSSSASASFSFTSTEAGSFECKMDAGSFVSCASPQSYSNLGNGSHTFQVRVTDLAGNVDPTPASYTWTIDVTVVTTGLVAAFGFDEGSGTTVGDSSGNGYTGNIIGAAWTASGKFGNALSFNGTSSYVSASIPTLPTGDYTWSSWVNPNQTGTFRGIMVSRGSGLGGVELDIDAGRINVWSNGNLGLISGTIIPVGVWTHVALTRAGSTIRLYINGSQDPNTGADGLANDFAGCPLLIGVDNDSGCTGSLNGNFDGLIDEIRVYNRALSQAEIQSYMNTPVTPVGPDTTPPETSITAAPANPSNSSSASFSFTSTEAGSSFECQLDGGSFGACTSPKSYTGLGEGSHTFQVRAIDSVSNIDPTPASYTWTIDSTPPDTTLTATPPNPSNNGNASFSFTSPESSVGFQCQLDGAAFAACTSPKSYTALASGSHIFQVRAVDAAGNVDPIPASYTWTYTPITRFPAATTIETGTLLAGTATSLNADDNNYYQVNSTSSGTRTTSWYGIFTSVPSNLSKLKVSYKGKNSQSCTQTIAIWRWTDSTWVQLDSRSVSTTEVSIANLVPAGAAGQYVNGATGELRVRIRCTRSGNFTTSGDLMNIVYDTP